MYSLPYNTRDAKGDPFCPPVWRWRYAAQIVERNERINRRRDDPDCITAVQYQRAIARCKTAAGIENAKRRSPDLSAAHELFLRADPFTWEIECRVLAAQSPDDIARQCGTSLETIRWFESLFFDVRPYLRATDWIVSRVIGSGVWYGFRDDDLAAIWRYFAYYGGLPSFEVLLDTFQRCWRPGRPAVISVYLHDDSDLPLTIQACIAAQVLPRFGPAADLLVDAVQRTCGRMALTAEDMRRDRVLRAVVRLGRDYLAGRVRRPRRVRTAPCKKQQGRRSSRGCENSTTARSMIASAIGRLDALATAVGV
jgi:hypothetical protein